MGNFFSDIMAGGVEGLGKGVGTLAKDLRTAMTGKEPMTSEQQASILERADALVAAGQELESKAALGQIDLNKLDAVSNSLYKGGWRPAIGWVCAGGLFYTFLLRPIMWWVVQTVIEVKGYNIAISTPPTLNMKDLMALTMCLLGFGGFRMYEKIKGKT